MQASAVHVQGGPALSQLRVAPHHPCWGVKLRSMEAAGGAPVLTPKKHSLAGEVLSRRVRFSGHKTAGGLGGEGGLCGREGRKE